MGNILRILKRDILRLLKAPAALVVVGALLILPSLYTWYNVIGFWNPYDNTGNMRVCVVNQDKGATSDLTGELNIGATIVEQLGENEQLDWVFDDYDTAMVDLESGRNYAVFVIPENFSENLLSLVSSNFQQPKIEYYVNEKISPVSPKVTDTGSGALEETINSAFITEVSNAVVKAIGSASGDLKDTLTQGLSKASQKISEAQASISDVRVQLTQLDATFAQVQANEGVVNGSLSNARVAVGETSATLADISTTSSAAQSALITATPQMAQAVNECLQVLIALQPTADAAGYGAQVAQAIASLQACQTIIFSTMIPATIQGLGNLSATSSQLSVTVANQSAIIDQAQAISTQVFATVGTMRTAVANADTLLVSVSKDLEKLNQDVTALSSSSLITKLTEAGALDATSISAFMGSPTSVVTERLYPLNAYGSAMAPLFMNLTFWIGAFMLLVIVRQEVDDEGLHRLTVAQRYLGRFSLLAGMAAIQAIVCCVGCMVIGVQVMNVPALFAASVVASLAYLSIIYALSVSFQHVGKGLCIVLVFIQIPAATGLYPIEMTSEFYQAVSPLFPFTYGIAAMREAIFGLYGAQYVHAIFCLAVFFVVFMVLGIVLQSRLANVNRLFEKQVVASGLFSGEKVEVPAREIRWSSLVKALSEHEDVVADFEVRYERFQRAYPKMTKAALVAGIAVPVLLSVVFSLTAGEKVVLLSLWTAWVLAVFIFLTVIETLHDSFERQRAVSDMVVGEAVVGEAAVETRPSSLMEEGASHE